MSLNNVSYGDPVLSEAEKTAIAKSELEHQQTNLVGLIELLTTPNVWTTASIDQEPEITLYQWSIKKMKEGSFFCGTTTGGTGRVSTDIKVFDPETKKGITNSGRIYQLVGESGYSSNGEYVWEYYKKLNRLTELTKSESGLE